MSLYPAILSHMKNPQERNNLRSRSGHSAGQLSFLIAVATFVLIIASLYWAQAVLIPLGLAFLLTFLLSPVADALERLALGRVPSVILVVVMTFSLLGGSAGSSLSNWAASLTNCPNTQVTSGKK